MIFAHRTTDYETALGLEKFPLSETFDIERCPSSRKNIDFKKFGKCHYENTAYFNFDENEEYMIVQTSSIR